MAPMTFAYWDIRGLAEPIRMLLSFVGEDWENKLYSCGPGPEYNKECWFGCGEGTRDSLGLAFPNLPYLIDGEIKITQSNAILRYIARKHDMCGKNEQERVLVDMMADQVMDLRNGFVRLCYGKAAFECNLPAYVKDLPSKLKPFEAFIGDRQFFCGDQPTFPDFHMAEMLWAHQKLVPNCLSAFPKLAAFFARFMELPKIQAYLKSDKYNDFPINNKMAAFGHSVL